MNLWRELAKRLNPETPPPTAEQWRSALAAALGALCVTWFSSQVLAAPLFLVAAVGASSALVFALPASPFAQPWAVIGGYAISALMGVLAAKLTTVVPLAAALAVGLSTLTMLALRCMHPPGGAVALFAVIGGERVTALGFGYVLAPVLANALMLIAVALPINNLLPGRRYPRVHTEPKAPATPDALPAQPQGITHGDLHAALVEYGHTLYISADELDAIVRLAEHNASRRHAGLPPDKSADRE